MYLLSITNKITYQINYKNLLTALHFDSGELEKAKVLVEGSNASIYWQAIFRKTAKKALKEQNADFFNLIN